ncbi:GBF-interacting protein 1-like isoform X1 [Ananas comosus]|uniref:GBF-interacting protein 1-like isoform X1 n=1 Tax=Ananas comosus TaxID=4615 RepID=A0A6P5G4Q4_ANACO|nr:GBF-interacting protein 1-like isoform X1 [Ananas comosus]
MSGGGIRVSIPAGVRRTIQNIKEIAGNHSDEEVYAMLKECSMDPNETAQKLLLQDTFHEVKKKRDKKKETNKESGESRWRPGPQGRGGRGGRGSFPSRYLVNDVGGRNVSSGKENGANQSTDKGSTTSTPIDTEIKPSISISSLAGGLANGVGNINNPTSSQGHAPQLPGLGGSVSTEENSSTSKSNNKTSSTSSTTIDNKIGSAGGQFASGPGSRPSSSSHGRASGSRPSSSYSSRSQQLGGPQKGVGPNKEWKPKTTNANPAQAPATAAASDILPNPAVAVTWSLEASSSVTTEEAALKVEKKLADLQLLDRQHVIIPDHLQVPESERYGLSFGSFDAGFEITTANGPASDKYSVPSDSELSQGIEGTVEEPFSSMQNASSAVEETEALDHEQSPTEMPENISREVEKSSSTNETEEADQSKEAAALPPEASHHPLLQTAPSYSTYGLVPQMLGNQFGSFETSDSQAHDTNRIPNIMASQESGNSLVFSSSASTPLTTQAAGVAQSSIAIPPQPVPVLRQPTGVHISHYPPNYFPYNQYFSPYYVPPPLHHFLSNAAAFPQQPPSGGIYPPGAAAAAATAAAPLKYPFSQYKSGGNAGNQANHVGMPTSYGAYSSSSAGYSTSAAAASGNSGGNDDISSAQFKESNVYIAGQQNEGSAVWIPTHGRDISSLQAGSFYGLPPQGQPMAFAPPQAGHGAFSGIYHPTQTVTAQAVHPLLQQSQSVAGVVEMVPPTGLYQQPQRPQINWTNNY